MPKKTTESSQPTPNEPEKSQAPKRQPEASREQEGTTSTSSPRTHVADDVSNLPTGEVEQSGPVTYQADHVPDDAPAVMQSKKVAGPSPEKPAPADADPETA